VRRAEEGNAVTQCAQLPVSLLRGLSHKCLAICAAGGRPHEVSKKAMTSKLSCSTAVASWCAFAAGSNPHLLTTMPSMHCE
jgi:hypothetical protein